MTELEAALLQNADQRQCLTEQQKRIAQLEEELAVMARQLAALTRYVFGKRSEPEPLGGAETDCDAGAARRAKEP